MAIAYYRTRPSEPEASDLALRLQREAAEESAQDAGGIDAEFIEREGEPGAEAYPAFHAAVRAANERSASNDGRCVELIIASHAAVGSGAAFKKPAVETAGDGFVITAWLFAATVPPPPVIAVPPGAPAPLCLFGDYRPGQADTLVYLCNAGAEAVTDAVLVIDTIDDYARWTSKRKNPRPQVIATYEKRLGAVPPGAGIWVGQSTHVVTLDRSCRYRLAYAGADGRRRAAEAFEGSITSIHGPSAPDDAWAAFAPLARPQRPA